MTYEDKLVEILNRFRGSDMDDTTLKAMEAACREEVWDHLPPKIRGSWKLHLGFSEDSPGQIELRPEQVSAAATAEDLGKTLQMEFQSFSDEVIEGGISGFSAGMAGNLDSAAAARTSPVVNEMPDDDAPPPEAAAEAPSEPPQTAAEPETETPGDAATITQMAADLGIDLPSNDSLLEPFLQALAMAHEYKQRLDVLEQAIGDMLDQ